MHDWMLVQFKTEAVGNQEAGVDYFPCKLAAVVLNNDLNVTNDNKCRLVIQCTIIQTGVKSALLTKWWWLPDYVITSSATISHP
jgi:hypothetical protein